MIKGMTSSFSILLQKFYAWVVNLPLWVYLVVLWGAFILVSVVALVMVLCRGKDGLFAYRALMRITCVLTFCFLVGDYPLAKSLIGTGIWWILAYLWYGLLCILPTMGSKQKKRPRHAMPIPVAIPTAVPNLPSYPSHSVASTTNVRLEHALSMTDRLLVKPLGKSDRQDVESIQDHLLTLQNKSPLTSAEGQLLNEHFNILLKLMAKYNV